MCYLFLRNYSILEIVECFSSSLLKIFNSIVNSTKAIEDNNYKVKHFILFHYFHYTNEIHFRKSIESDNKKMKENFCLS